MIEELTPLVLMSTMVLVILVSSCLTLALSALLMWRYRLAVARAMAETLAARGLRIVSGRTESHLFLVDLRAKRVTGKDAEAALGKAHITVNKNAIPNDPEKPFVTSGIRIGSPAMTTRLSLIHI